MTSETNLFVRGFTHFVGLFLVPNASLLLGSYITTWEGQFSPHSYGKKMRKFMPSPHKKISCQNQLKSSTTLLTWHTTRATHQCKCSFWPRFMEILCFSYLCVKFHHSECIFTIYYNRFASSPNYGRGVIID